jgi:hypothetical protein
MDTMSSVDSPDDNEVTSENESCLHILKFISDDDFYSVLTKVHECGTILSLHEPSGDAERLDRFVMFWTTPESRQVWDEHVYKVYYAGATSCLLGPPHLMSFEKARHFSRFGITITALLDGYDSLESLQSFLARNFEMIDTDRGLVSYLKAKIECHCLDELAMTDDPENYNMSDCSEHSNVRDYSGGF